MARGSWEPCARPRPGGRLLGQSSWDTGVPAQGSGGPTAAAPCFPLALGDGPPGGQRELRTGQDPRFSPPETPCLSPAFASRLCLCSTPRSRTLELSLTSLSPPASVSYKVPQTEWLHTAEAPCLTAPKARSPRSRCGPGSGRTPSGGSGPPSFLPLQAPSVAGTPGAPWLTAVPGSPAAQALGPQLAALCAARSLNSPSHKSAIPPSDPILTG